MRAALVQFLYESNTFSPVEGDLALFQHGGVWLEGEDHVRPWAQGTDSQMRGSLQVLEQAGVETAPCFAAVCGSPAGRLSQTCLWALRDTITRNLQAVEPFDGLVLHLHGAASAVGEDDVEGWLLEAIRETCGPIMRVVVSLDLHANLTRRLVRHADAITAYRTMPHRDLLETGERAARLLLHPGEYRMTMVKVAALIPPTDTSDLHGLFAEVLKAARRLETRAGVVDVSVFPVQPWLDVAELGSAIVATVEPGTDVDEELMALGRTWFDQRDRWETRTLDWETILGKLREVPAQPWILVETSDATSGGATGRSVEALRRLWAWRDSLPGDVLLWVVCPETVQAAWDGACEFQTGEPAFHWSGEVLQTGDGRYRARGKAYTGQSFSMGRMAVIAAGRLRVVVCENPALVSDPAFYESVGLNPEQGLAVLTKSHAGWLAGYDCGPERGLLFNAPGVTSLNFNDLPFSAENRERLFPLSPKPADPVRLWSPK